MSDRTPSDSVAPESFQSTFARVLYWGNALGVICLVLGLVAYFAGWMDTFVPRDSLAHYSMISMEQFKAETRIELGWAWLRYLDHVDYLNYIGLAILSGITILCYMTLVPAFSRRGERAYVILVVLQVAVFLAAMTGLVGGAH
ncbi:MAG: hypothetical protein ACI9OU_000581 [Candidatus Promineifilaceae bacterium]|jgi:hypothetical protein